MVSLAVEAAGITFRYGREAVIRQADIAVTSGTFACMIGPNGSGKSTLLRLLAGIVRLQTGTVRYFGRSIRRMSAVERARQIAWVPQTLPADIPFSVRHTVMLGRAPHLGLLGIPGKADHRRVDQALEMTGTDHLADRRMNQLSGGERQRVFIARALAQSPKLFFLDEPTAALDLGHQIQIMDLMETLKTDNAITVFMVSHDINLAALYADRLFLLHQGQVIRTGRPHTVLTQERLASVYQCPVIVEPSTLGDFPRVSPVPGRVLRARQGQGAGRND
ncbi:MAG: ABC transporter [Deltaproteobacteria bacterium]|nr:MAG: ABC transporter [Deltaproteobacteria bacterium]